jgi:hypothetical protein
MIYANLCIFCNHTHFVFCCRLLRLLGDFGLVRLLESTCELAHSRVGTPYYLSPVPWESLGAGRSGDGAYPLVIFYRLLLKMVLEFVDLSIENGGFP